MTKPSFPATIDLMPNTSSAKKALRQAERRQVNNLRRRRAYKAIVKEAKKLAVAGNGAAAVEKLPAIYKALDKAAKTQAIKKNTASRLKSRVSKFLQKKNA